LRLFCGGTTLAATTAPRPKKAPWENAVTIARHEQRIARCDGAQAIPKNKDSDQQQQRPAAIEACGGNREDRRPNTTPSA